MQEKWGRHLVCLSVEKVVASSSIYEKKSKIESWILFSEKMFGDVECLQKWLYQRFSEVSKQCASSKQLWKYHTYLYCLDFLAMNMRALTCWCYCAVLASWFKYKQMSIRLYIRGLLSANTGYVTSFSLLTSEEFPRVQYCFCMYVDFICKYWLHTWYMASFFLAEKLRIATSWLGDANPFPIRP